MCGLTAYRVHQNSALKYTVSEINFNIIENGFQKKFREWTNQYMTSVWKSNSGKTEKQQQAINLTQFAGGILLYMIGMAIGILAFIVEICYSRF